MRPDWDSYFMKIAYAVSERSTCDRAFVGSVIVLDKRILTTGFNGSPAGQDHCDEIGHLMVDGHCVRTIHAEGYPAGEMKHGPIALIDKEMPVLCIAPKDPWHEKMISQIQQAKARDGIVIAVATEGDELVKGMADHVLWIPEAPWMLSPILTVLPLQLLAYHIAAIRGLDVDQPRNLAKSVTVE